ncbi:hypothetical protein DCCM_2805 [Desulfocucumis palustris]|uniref:Uncharacterized protein n=1 Tax=Desulfocucumis palustris TaxID=1898651 RepID=A0A2L2XBK6_9FIRM|nr:hypothetical protein DCCM_2805 [Desulfocucumis palustris]
MFLYNGLKVYRIRELVDLLKEAVTHALSQPVAEPTRALSERLKGFSDKKAQSI